MLSATSPAQPQPYRLYMHMYRQTCTIFLIVRIYVNYCIQFEYCNKQLPGRPRSHMAVMGNNCS